MALTGAQPKAAQESDAGTNIETMHNLWAWARQERDIKAAYIYT